MIELVRSQFLMYLALGLALAMGAQAPTSIVPTSAHRHAAEIELLEQLIVQRRANWEAIRTWQGEVSKQARIQTRVRDSRWDLRRTYHITHFFDRASDQYLFTHDCTLETGFKGDQAPDGEYSIAIAKLRVADTWYTFGPWHYKGRKVEGGTRPDVRPTLTTDSSSTAHPVVGDHFDPFYFLGIQGSMGEKGLSYWIENREELGDSLKIAHQGAMVVIESGKKQEGMIHAVYKFDLQGGGNLVDLEVNGPQGYHSRVQSRFERIAGVWLPVEASFVLEIPDRESRNHVTLKWISNVVNEPLPKDAFSWHRLGVRKGDRVFDRRTNVEYTFDGEEETTVAAAGAAASRWPWVVGTGSAAVLLALLGLWLRRRLSARDRPQQFVDSA
ncbi:MAG TPA: hypothetical protein PKD86_03825 [Gemmatales bacterium]|nr:hypothetical protein [Gemmatales bacterium]HMP58463.1 hypothetical protein [Gemmatales bacterium]